jgi:hypothetical protein
MRGLRATMIAASARNLRVACYSHAKEMRQLWKASQITPAASLNALWLRAYLLAQERA